MHVRFHQSGPLCSYRGTEKKAPHTALVLPTGPYHPPYVAGAVCMTRQCFTWGVILATTAIQENCLILDDMQVNLAIYNFSADFLDIFR